MDYYHKQVLNGEGKMNALSNQLNDLMSILDTMKGDPNANKLAVNKTKSRMQDALLWSMQIFGEVAEAPKCVCPVGAIDQANCVVHKAVV